MEVTANIAKNKNILNQKSAENINVEGNNAFEQNNFNYLNF